ncbi:1647_t:CDS:2 [Gigaspora margarita]|uniref:1647_t:CDS:1 n=1 Tax=Gigaspora margarita TaxID=4874 RepID=A0ABN7ULE0_GIGMA|nr:1647_t:CDS:2 [Gigaspora margarita]
MCTIVNSPSQGMRNISIIGICLPADLSGTLKGDNKHFVKKVKKSTFVISNRKTIINESCQEK